MFRKLLQRTGLVHTPNLVYARYEVRVFVTSEGTAQGIPRPLQVLTKHFSWELDRGDDFYLDPEARIQHAVDRIVRNGFEHTLKNGTKEKFPPHTIYKVTYKDVTNDI